MNSQYPDLVIHGWLPFGIMLPAVYEDIKHHSFHFLPCLSVAVVNLLYILIFFRSVPGQLALWMIEGAVPGILLALLSSVTGRWIGEGDCLLLMLTGVFKGWQFVLSMLFFSFLLIFIMAVLMMMFREFDRTITLPMVPFLVAGYICAQCYMYG